MLSLPSLILSHEPRPKRRNHCWSTRGPLCIHITWIHALPYSRFCFVAHTFPSPSPKPVPSLLRVDRDSVMLPASQQRRHFPGIPQCKPPPLIPEYENCELQEKCRQTARRLSRTRRRRPFRIFRLKTSSVLGCWGLLPFVCEHFLSILSAGFREKLTSSQP